MADAPAYFMAEQLDAIIGIRIAGVDHIKAKSKLSQNRMPEDFDSVTEELGKRGKPDWRGACGVSPMRGMAAINSC